MADRKSSDPCVIDLRRFLEGSWALARLVTDYRGREPARFEGRAAFVPEGPDLVYRETGRFTLESGIFEAEQSYLYVFPDRHRAEIHFHDGRPFHDLDFSTGRWSAEHFCAPDRYRGEFRIAEMDLWTASWRIEGPRKDQLIETRFSRVVASRRDAPD